MIKVLEARFVVSAVAPEGYPRGEVPEFAFAGRSNVGKSSMINALTGRRKLVRVSHTPGRTRTLNFFEVELAKDGRRRTFRLTDLPGYGYAKVSRTEREQWRKMISAYLDQRQDLRAVVTIIDAEVGPTGDDQQLIDLLGEKGRRALVVATKIDRLPKARRKPRLRELAEALGVSEEVVVPFSATERIGVEEVWEALWESAEQDGRG